MILLENISVKFGKQSVINNLSFEFKNGVFYGITGPSGIGKTTLLGAIAGTVPLSGGKINADISHISYIFQDPRLFPWLTAIENVECVCHDREKAKYYLSLLLPEGMEKYPSALSGGMKQRVSIARALAYDAPLVLLDEPFKGLDIETKQTTIDIVTKHLRGRTAILVSHELSELALCDKIYKTDISPVTSLLQTQVKSGSANLE